MRMLLDKELSIVKTYCDSAASIAVILGLLLVVIFGSIFLTVQAYKESVYFVQTGGSIINSTIVHNPELHDLLPEGWQSTMDTALNNAYIYVRESLAKMDKGIEEDRREELERSALELWDRVYQAWVMPLQQPTDQNTPLVGPTVTAEAVIHSYSTLIEGLRKTPEVVSLKSLGVLLSDNMSTLSAGLDSLLAILKGNFTLLLNILSTLFSLIFGGGMSVINFTLHMVVFLTALFYLLSTSRQLYKPVEVVTHMSPKYGNKLAVAVENACQEVLTASVKLSVFYGMWTWLIHTIFQSNIVYMPSVFAAILGGMPVLGTYWVCLPALLDLWLVQDSKLLALGLLIAQFLPTMIVDSTVYNEIQGGHPYLTGLSVAGGMFWLGIEGAVVGPLMLCFLFVIVNMASSIATSPSPPQSTND
ncbi:hypothetical protein AAG570_003132 [Ranatra chinensis]|uniref:Transmembrane protein 245 n=1 Tax=Ranatra chinensis TaxID=642074 RepID=A0ABD0Y5W5_9HEMI